MCQKEKKQANYGCKILWLQNPFSPKTCPPINCSFKGSKIICSQVRINQLDFFVNFSAFFVKYGAELFVDSICFPTVPEIRRLRVCTFVPAQLHRKSQGFFNSQASSMAGKKKRCAQHGFPWPDTSNTKGCASPVTNFTSQVEFGEPLFTSSGRCDLFSLSICHASKKVAQEIVL